MLKELDNYDWQEVFKYANPEVACPGMTVDTSRFTRDDVETVIDMEDGEK